MSGRFAGVILAGGRSSRMSGHDKALMPLAGLPLAARAVARFTPQVEIVAINANGDPSRFAGMGVPVLADTIPGFRGPLAGVLAGMAWAAGFPGITHVATTAVDTPFFPADLVVTLARALDAGGGPIALAESVGRRHPVFGLWALALQDDLSAFLDAGGAKVAAFADRHGAAVASFPPIMTGAGPLDPFFNLNEPSDLHLAGKFSQDIDR